jgi:hypothetical protein
MRRWAWAAVLGVISAVTTVAHSEPSTGDRPSATCWSGQWREPAEGGECVFTFVLRLTAAGPSTAGAFTWRLVRCPGLEDRAGDSGVERVSGTSDAVSARLVGSSVSDPTLLSTDEYRLSFEGDRLTGTTGTNERDWNGRITGRRIVCRN